MATIGDLRATGITLPVLAFSALQGIGIDELKSELLSALDAMPKLLLDPNTLSADGTVAINSYTVSEDGELLAYSLATSGSDWV